MALTRAWQAYYSPQVSFEGSTVLPIADLLGKDGDVFICRVLHNTLLGKPFLQSVANSLVFVKTILKIP